MELVRPAKGDKPELYRLAEMTEAESKEGSGVFDDNGVEMNNRQFTDMWGREVLGMDTTLANTNGMRTPEAQRQSAAVQGNKSLTYEQRVDRIPVAVIGSRATDEQRAAYAEHYPNLKQ